MPSFGEKLKLEREKRKVTLEQISLSTKIGIRMLQALEEDKFDQLPGGIFNKGFVRAYSRFLGLDEDQIIADYLQASGDAPPVSTEPASHEAGSREDATRENQEKISRLEAGADAPPRQVPWGVFAAVLLIVALALSFWSHRRREHTRPSDRSGEVSVGASSGASVGTSVKDSGVGSPPSGSPTSGSPREGLSTTSSATRGSPNRESASSPVTKTSHDLATASSTVTPAEFTVVIQAREDSWIAITVDGKTISSELLPAGSERTIQGRKEVIVRAGNAGGVDFRFNEKKVDIGGDYGEVKTVTFGPRGILPIAPPPPSTP